MAQNLADIRYNNEKAYRNCVYFIADVGMLSEEPYA